MTDLYVDILKETQLMSLSTNLERFLNDIIRLSYKYPLISGFYKLVHAILRKYHNSEDEDEGFHWIKKYISNILKLISTFSNELLISCLYLILGTPSIYLKSELLKTVATFKTAFNLGLTNLDLGFTAFVCLEKVTHNIRDKDLLVEFFQKILPCLEPYLQTMESSTGLRQDLMKDERKTIRWATLILDHRKLEDLQTRILLFLGTLDSIVALNFVHERALDTGASWIRKDLVKYTLPYTNMEINIYFDNVLPRLAILAESSCDRHTKVAACEVLHAMTSYIIGKSGRTPSDSDRFNSVSKLLFPTLLRLGCDQDEVASQLFHPLTLQLTHWLSSRVEFREAQLNLLDSIFESLCDESNSSLINFCGMCLATFLECSMQRMDENIQGTIDVVMRKLFNYALHVGANKKVAAAAAFNYIYKILQEDDEVISKYCLEMLYCFVKYLDGCNSPIILTAIDHIERIVKDKAFVLNQDNENRRKPLGFKDKTLIAAVAGTMRLFGS